MSENTQAISRERHACEAMFRGRRLVNRALQPAYAEGFGVAAFAADGSPSRSWLQPAKAGGARRDRTDDLMLAKHALSQLSYGPVTRRRMPQVLSSASPRKGARSIRMVGLGRLELPTSRLSSARSNQLSYKPAQEAWHAHTQALAAPDAIAQRSPWRVFVREERETKTAKSRLMELIRSGDRWPLMFLKRSDRSA
jgi:hypothetical protein